MNGQQADISAAHSAVPTSGASRHWLLVAAFAVAEAIVFAVVTGPLWGRAWSEGFRNYFANDQLSYAAIATNVASGGSILVEPFTHTGTSTYPSGWYLVVGAIGLVTGQPVWALWQVLGVNAVMIAVGIVGWVAWRVSQRRWAPLLPALALLTGTLALRTSGDWLTVLGHHAVLWGPFGTLFTLNAEAVGVSIAAAALALLVLGGVTHRPWLAVVTAGLTGLLANVQTYTFLASAVLAAMIIASTGVLIERERTPRRAFTLAVTSALLLIAVIAFGPLLAQAIGPLPLFVLLLASLAPAAWPLARQLPTQTIAALIVLAVAAAPQVLRTLLGLANDDPFLRYRQESSMDLGVPPGPAIIAAIPLILVGIACATAVWRRRQPMLAAVLIALPIAAAVMTTNDRWGFNQEPYRFWLQLAILGALLLSIVLAWSLAQWRTSTSRRRTVFATTAGIALVVWLIAAWDVTAWWSYARAQGVITVTDEPSEQLAALLDGREGLVMSSQCTDPRVLKLVHGGPVAFYNAGLAWPPDEQAFKIFQDKERRASEDYVALTAAEVSWVVTDARCPTDWQFARGVPIMQVAAQGPWRLWRVE